MTADLARKDLLSAGIGDGRYGFEIRLPDDHGMTNEEGIVRVNVVGTNIELVHHLNIEASVQEVATAPARPQEPVSMIRGSIDTVSGGRITGWIQGPADDVYPVVLVDGVPATLTEYPATRDDAVVPVEAEGFSFKYGAARVGARVQLFAYTDQNLVFVAAHEHVPPKLQTGFISQLARACEIAKSSAALAITVWEGGHEQVERAKALYDIAGAKRPVVLIYYLFDELGGAIWSPLHRTDCAMLTIPWSQRMLYHHAIRRSALAFDTVWICGPRYPGFVLANLVARPDARLILDVDVDSDEEQPSQDQAAREQPYGLPTMNLSRHLVAAIAARTVSSPALQAKFGGQIVRSDAKRSSQNSNEGAYEAFATAEAQAGAQPRAGNVLTLLPAEPERKTAQPVLLLVWKQQDAGLYGRRVDQIARAYKHAYPDHRAIIVELLHDKTVAALRKEEASFPSDRRLMLNMMEKKETGLHAEDGTELYQVRFNSSITLKENFQNFLLRETILPSNTVVILFPILPSLELLYDTLSPYRTMTDVVDNQAAAIIQSANIHRKLQYSLLFKTSETVIFNSQRNLDFFVGKQTLPQDCRPLVIPNWYQLPPSARSYLEPRQDLPGFNIVYSGNMNDRMNWPLIRRVAQMSDDIVLHLVGAIRSDRSGLLEVLDQPNIVFHGPMSEQDTLRLLGAMDLAIMPHVEDDISTFMNPLKVQMYAAVGLHTVSSDVPGIVPASGLTIVGTDAKFVETIAEFQRAKPPRQPAQEVSHSIKSYIEEIERLRSGA